VPQVWKMGILQNYFQEEPDRRKLRNLRLWFVSRTKNSYFLSIETVSNTIKNCKSVKRHLFSCVHSLYNKFYKEKEVRQVKTFKVALKNGKH
jgi:hypothetical protein